MSKKQLKSRIIDKLNNSGINLERAAKICGLEVYDILNKEVNKCLEKKTMNELLDLLQKDYR